MHIRSIYFTSLCPDHDGDLPTAANILAELQSQSYIGLTP